MFFEAYDDTIKFFADKTNTTVIQCPRAEADDLIAIWIQEHPDDNLLLLAQTVTWTY